jgi:hypothetical protein
VPSLARAESYAELAFSVKLNRFRLNMPGKMAGWRTNSAWFILAESDPKPGEASSNWIR